MAGHGLYGTAEDYAKFIRMWLNDGAGPGGEQILRPRPSRWRRRNQPARGHVHQDAARRRRHRGGQDDPSHIEPASVQRREFFPGMPKTWALTFMINEGARSTGRPAGALAWAGLANLYFWIDRANGVGGFWATQIFPFVDPTSVGGFLDFEKAVYDNAT